MADLISQLVASGHIADALLALLACEMLVLGLLLDRRRRRAMLPAFVAGIGAGAGLILALRAALTGAHWGLVVAGLAGAGVAHAIELILRLKAERP